MIQKSLLALRVKSDYEIEQPNIITAFFKSLMEETMYLKQPHGFEKPKDTSCTQVCHLSWALYGLKQSPQKCYLPLVDYLKNLGSKCLEYDYCVFILQNGFIIAIYLDKNFFCDPDLAGIGQLKKQPSDKFCMRDIEVIFCYLGMEVNRD